MNSFVLMATIIQNPQLRFTKESELAIAEMMVEFDNLSPNNPSSTLKVIGWGSIAQEVNEKYKEGDKVIISGRLKMDTIERQEGFKEKRAELTISSIYPVNSNSDHKSPSNAIPFNSSSSSAIDDIDANEHQSGDANEDDIPF